MVVYYYWQVNVHQLHNQIEARENWLKLPSPESRKREKVLCN